MAVGNRGKNPKGGEIFAYSEMGLRNNAAVVEYCRTSMAALSGGTAGLSIYLLICQHFQKTFHFDVNFDALTSLIEL